MFVFKNFLKAHFLFIILLIILAVYLGLKTVPEDGWDEWGFGTAQVLMSAKYWAEDGIVNHKFLTIPMGYNKVVQYLDEPEMRHHARGAVTGGLIGRRLYYTHYPSGYVFPPTLLMKLGIDYVERHWYRILSLMFSLSALIFMYAFFCYLSNRLIAFLATLYYAGSTMFLGFADTVCTPPVDDFFRFLILLLSVLAFRSVSDVKKFRIYNIAIWASYLLLSISSYDSTFFIFVWLVGLDIIIFKKFLWKRWLIFALAPILAFCLQVLQNIWYFGDWRTLWLDTMGAGVAKAQSGSLWLHIKSISRSFYLLTGFSALWSTLGIAGLFVGFWKFKKSFQLKNFYTNNIIWILIILFLAGSIFPFLFAGGVFEYQGRQMAPFVGLLFGLIIYLVGKNLFSLRRKKILIVLFFIVLVFWAGQIIRTIDYVKDWPNNTIDKNIVEFSKSLKEKKDGVVFRIDNLPSKRYPNIDPRVEYYIELPVLSFENREDLINDYNWLKNRSEFPFKAIILATDQEEKEKIKLLFEDNKEVIILIGPSLNI
ncbi:hypothetical protein ACFLZC_00465 [Patescibacteria group bacterium]